MPSTAHETDFSVLDLLNREWQTRHATATYDFDELGIMTGAELVQYLSVRSAPKVDQDARLHQAITLAQASRTPAAQAAGRAVLQRMIPTAVRLAATCTALVSISTDEAIGTAVSCLWQAIQCYPAHIRRSVQGTLQLNTLSLINSTEGVRRRERRVDVIPTDADDLDVLADREEEIDYELGSSATGDRSFDDLVRVLTWAIDTKVLEREEVSILARADLGDAEDRAELAKDLGCTAGTMTKRVWRIRKKLIDAVRTYVTEHGSW